MSVPPLYAGTQLWLRDGRAVVPQPIELFRLLKLADSIHDSFITANPNAPPSATYGNAGDGIAVRLAEPMAARLTTRLRALAARDAYDSAADDGSFERRAAAHFDVIDDGGALLRRTLHSRHHRLAATPRRQRSLLPPEAAHRRHWRTSAPICSGCVRRPRQPTLAQRALVLHPGARRRL